MLKYAFSHRKKKKKHNRKSFCGHRNKPNTLLAPPIKQNKQKTSKQTTKTATATVLKLKLQN